MIVVCACFRQVYQMAAIIGGAVNTTYAISKGEWTTDGNTGHEKLGDIYLQGRQRR